MKTLVAPIRKKYMLNVMISKWENKTTKNKKELEYLENNLSFNLFISNRIFSFDYHNNYYKLICKNMQLNVENIKKY